MRGQPLGLLFLQSDKHLPRSDVSEESRKKVNQITAPGTQSGLSPSGSDSVASHNGQHDSCQQRSQAKQWCDHCRWPYQTKETVGNFIAS